MSQAIHIDCLSPWRLGQAARQEVALDARDQAHLATCERCRGLLQEHEAGQLEAAHQPVPTALLRHLGNKRVERRRRMWAQGTAAAGTLMAACLAWVLLPQGALLSGTSGTPTQTKGGADLLVTAMRDDAIILEETPLMATTGLRTGDRLRLRVVADDDNRYVELDSAGDHDSWDSLYAGELPNDHWLPVGVRLDGTSQTVLRLRVCPDAQQRDLCVERIFKLQTP